MKKLYYLKVDDENTKNSPNFFYQFSSMIDRLNQIDNLLVHNASVSEAAHFTPKWTSIISLWNIYFYSSWWIESRVTLH